MHAITTHSEAWRDDVTAVEAHAGPLADAVRRLTATGSHVDGAPPPGALIAVRRHHIRSRDFQSRKIQSRDIPSAASAGIVDFAVAGLARQGTLPAPMTFSARTDAGSLTKVVATTAALMALVDADEVAVDDPAERYLPYLSGRRFTVRDLLEHRAGLWEWWPLYLSGAVGAHALALAAALPPRHPVGAARHYSDLGFMLLGDLVARVSGTPLADAVERLAFRPFGLSDTRYAAPVPGGQVIASSHGDAIERRMIETGVPYPVDGNAADFGGWRTHDLAGEVNDGNAYHAFGGVAGHAGLFTTARDLLAFADGMMSALDGGGPVRRGTALAFTTAGADPEQALGFRFWHDGSREHDGASAVGSSADAVAIGHAGFPGVAFAFLPDARASVVMITNRLHAPGVPDRREPRSTEAMWRLARAAARAHLNERAESADPAHRARTVNRRTS
jgi:CubicO group peptidase (beta-lactamase class C family)